VSETKHEQLYDDALASGCTIDHWESDLYLEWSAVTREVLRRWPDWKPERKIFRSPADGKLWCVVAFAYAPWWRERRAKALALKGGRA
jgi:hypothetical protein